MQAKLSEKEIAIKLRKQGRTYPEICRQLNIAKGSCSLWLSGVKLNARAQKRIEKLKELSRAKGRLMAKNNRDLRDKQIKERVGHVIKDLVLNERVRKIICAVLYWAEGQKHTSSLAFTNSDPVMVRTYLRLLRTAFLIKESKLSAWLHLHDYHNEKTQKAFWSEVTGISMDRISIYHKPNSSKNIRSGYPGCIAIRYGDVKLAKEIEFLYKLFADKLLTNKGVW